MLNCVIFATLESVCSTESNNNTIDSASTSTTPVSDTTVSDSDPGETQSKIVVTEHESDSDPGETQSKIVVTEHETVQMEENAPT